MNEYKWIVVDFPEIAFDWLSKEEFVHPKTIAFILNLISPTSQVITHIDDSIWLKIIESLKGVKKDDGFFSEEIDLKICQILLAVAFNNPNPNFYKLMSFSFPIVHNSLSKGKYDIRFWRSISPRLPSIPWPFSWDRGEQLRIGLVDHFIKNNWPYEEFLKCLKDPKVFNLVLDSSKFNYTRKHFFSRIAIEAEKGNIQATDFQISGLQRFLS